MTVFFCYPKGLNKVLTMSYDDGVVQDRRLVDIFNKHGLKGSFHLNSARLGSAGCIATEEVAELYRGHEVSCHGATHALEAQIPRSMVMTEVWNDRLALEDLCGYPVCGMSYPNDSRDPGNRQSSTGSRYRLFPHSYEHRKPCSASGFPPVAPNLSSYENA